MEPNAFTGQRHIEAIGRTIQPCHPEAALLQLLMRELAMGSIRNKYPFGAGVFCHGGRHQSLHSAAEHDHVPAFDVDRHHRVCRIADRVHKRDDLQRDFFLVEHHKIARRNFNVLCERTVVMDSLDHRVAANMSFSESALVAFPACHVHFRRCVKMFSHDLKELFALGKRRFGFTTK